MFQLFNNLFPFYYPEDVITQSPDLGKDDILELLEDDSKESKKEDKEDNKEDDEKKDEEAPELEIKEDEEEEVKDEVDEGPTLIHASPKQILKKYPKLFEEFPSLKNAYYKEQQYSEVFPSVKDAREASEKASELDGFEAQLLKGDTKEILKTVKDNNPNAFNKIVDSYLDTLRDVDPNAHLHLISNITKDIITHIAKSGKSSNDEDLLATAAKIHEFFFGKTDWVPPQKLSKEVKEEDNQVEKERQELLAERLEFATNDVSDKVENSLKATIRAYIDPRSQMSDYVKKNAEKDVLEELYNTVRSDTRFMRAYDELWKNAAKEKFSKPSLDKIKSAYQAKAKTLLPTLIKASREAALKGAEQKKVDNEEGNNKKGHVPIGKPAAQNRSASNGKKDIPKGMSTLDYFNMD